MYKILLLKQVLNNKINNSLKQTYQRFLIQKEISSEKKIKDNIEISQHI